MPGASETSLKPPRWLVGLLLVGLFLSTRGYRSREGDQAYRLPLLFHHQNPAVYANDPFVRSFDAFNPHRGYITLLDAGSRVIGLSAALAALFALTLMLTCHGLDRLASAAWPGLGWGVGAVAAGLVLVAQAGNIGTNHLFEPILLDRLIAFAIGWQAMALVVATPARGRKWAPWLIGAAALVHPTVGIQLGMLLAGYWVVEAVLFRIDWRSSIVAVVALAIALTPGVLLNLSHSSALLDGLPQDEFRLLSVELQSPQHMLPHRWRMPQWLAWGCYPWLALVAQFASWRDERNRAKSEVLISRPRLSRSFQIHPLRGICFPPFLRGDQGGSESRRWITPLGRLTPPCPPFERGGNGLWLPSVSRACTAVAQQIWRLGWGLRNTQQAGLCAAKSADCPSVRESPRARTGVVRHRTSSSSPADPVSAVPYGHDRARALPCGCFRTRHSALAKRLGGPCPGCASGRWLRGGLVACRGDGVRERDGLENDPRAICGENRAHRRECGWHRGAGLWSRIPLPSRHRMGPHSTRRGGSSGAAAQCVRALAGLELVNETGRSAHRFGLCDSRRSVCCEHGARRFRTGAFAVAAAARPRVPLWRGPARRERAPWPLVQGQSARRFNARRPARLENAAPLVAAERGVQSRGEPL